MKKLSMLIALILCVTIGGVYATWSFAATNDVVDESKEITITMTDAKTEGAYGTYTIDVSNVAIVIDQESVTSHKAVLKVDEASKIVVTFTAADNAPVDVKENGVASTYTLSTSKVFTYNMDAQGNYKADGTPATIFTLNDCTAKNITWVPQGNGVFTFTLDAAAIEAMITLNDFTLDLLSEYQAFKSAINGNFIFAVSDGIHSGTQQGA